jgi:hypothetical protein
MISIFDVKNLVKKSLYCSISIITKEGLPHSSPIGSVYLNNSETGYFIEMFAKSFKDQEGRKGSILAVNSSLLFWLRSLIKGKFLSPPAVRLLVTFGERRKISEVESKAFQKRVNIFKPLKGYKLMWSKAEYVRPFEVDEIIPVSIGKMTR